MSDVDGVDDLLAAFHAAFAAGDADLFADLFADDGGAYLLYREPLIGRAAIRDLWRGFFARHDTSAWEPRTELIERHGDRAYVFSTYTEHLRDREGGSRQLIRGRLVHFLRRDADGQWRIGLLMNSHSHPMEPLP